MKILNTHIRGFKSISNAELSFRSGQPTHIHILAGRNNVGKTAVLEALAKVCQCSLIENEKSISLTEFMEEYNVNNSQSTKFYILNIALLLSKSEFETLFQLTSANSFDLERSYQVRLIIKDEIILSYEIGLFSRKTSKPIFKPISAEYLKKFPLFNHIPLSNDQIIREFKKAFLSMLQNSIVYISVHRQIKSPSSIKPCIDLNSNVSNLYTVLYTLRNNYGEIFDEIQKQFIQIFPDVARIHTYIDYNQEEQGNFTQIMLEFENYSQTIPLEECGSGYTQVLILLCLIHSKKERIILFDEPHLYLHPHAEKSIYDLAVRNAGNQYFFSTHSPILINYPVKKRIYFVTKEKNISSYVEMTDIHDVLEDLGVSNSDFSFSDRVIFVEGLTEENILPLIFENNGFRQIGFNYKIISLNGTDREFTKRSAMANNSSKLESIFNAISNSPIPYTIMLDKDEKTPEKIKELKETYKDKVVILPRREIENYFLITPAVYNLIKKHKPEQDLKIEDIQKSIQNCLDDKDNRTFYPKGCNNPIEDIKASMVLEEVLNTYSIRYNKIRDGLYIAEWLYQNGYRELDEIYEFFADFLQRKQLVTNTQ
ncbi:ATP-dependent nuclease [Bacillus cereus]|uniref:ATP-dependent nuclease n=1 Tax=Bacillus cereus TaxID=1396 RepID=UPI0018F28FFD|nr:AAA family ATPase [Bacillus cereus]MBJ8152958.1 AAA family ATPase [Bacillus cereus]